MHTVSTTIRPWLSTAAKNFQVALRILISMAVLGGWISASRASTYTFMTVTGNNVVGNGASSTFTSGLGNGVIGVTHFSNTPNSLGNWGTADNINSLIIPSKFATLFPGSGNVDGHVAQSMYGDPAVGSPPNTTVVTFDLTTYTGFKPKLVFGIWNTTTEVGQRVYNVQLKNASNVIGPPSSFNILGNDDNTGSAGVLGLHQMLFTPATGDITFNPAILNSTGVHTDAMFFDGIPLGTKEIIVTGNLPPLNNLGDGVGYYFAELPEPSTFVLGGLGLIGLLAAARRRRRTIAHGVATA